MEQDSVLTFFNENEQRVNKTVSKIFCWGIISGPAMIAARYFKIFPNVPYKPLFIFSAAIVVLCVFQLVYLKLHPFNHFAKYLCLTSLEFLIAYLAVTPGLCLFISYLIVPVLSCMYYDKRFTRTTCIVCYVVMIGTLYVRSCMPLREPADGLNGMTWFAAYAIGSTIEYFSCMILVYNVTRTSREMLDKQHQQDEKIREMQTKLITGFANLVESKDFTTGEHVKRTSEYVRLICYKLRELGYYLDELTDTKINYMIKAAPLHDLGKIGISENILCKAGKLTKDEINIIKLHPLYGERLIEKNLSGIEDDDYTEVAEIMALCHHEWWNGKGYPLRLIGTEIPLCARVMAAADVLDALLSVRPYNDAFSIDDTMAMMKQLSGTQFDPAVVHAVEALKNEIAEQL